MQRTDDNDAVADLVLVLDRGPFLWLRTNIDAKGALRIPLYRMKALPAPLWTEQK